MSKNVLSKVLVWQRGNFFYPLFELLRNDCTLSVDIVTNTLIANHSSTPDDLYMGYDSWSEKKSVAKISVIIRGANDYSSNRVGKVYYSTNDKLTLDDFTIYTDAINKNLFGLKEYNGHIYFCSYITDHKANYTVNVLSYDKPPYAESGLSCCAYRPTNFTDDYDVFTQYWQNVDKKAEYTQFDRGCVHKILLPSNNVLKVTLNTQWARLILTAKGTGISKTVNEVVSIYQQSDLEELRFRYFNSVPDGKIYIDSEDVVGRNPYTFYLLYDSVNYDETIIDIIGSPVANVITDVIPKSEFSTDDKTEITSRATYGVSPEWFERSTGSMFFETWQGEFPNTPMWWNGGGWVLASGFTVAKTKGWSDTRPTGKHTEGNTTVGVLNPYTDVGFEFFDTKLNKTLRAKAINIDTGVVTWVEPDGAVADVNRNGTFDQKPVSADIYIGFAYFCTDKQTTEGATNGIMIYYKGQDTTDPEYPVDIWVDALGRVVS